MNVSDFILIKRYDGDEKFIYTFRFHRIRKHK